jgi:hypothetical protein
MRKSAMPTSGRNFSRVPILDSNISVRVSLKEGLRGLLRLHGRFREPKPMLGVGTEDLRDLCVESATDNV